MGKCVMCKVDYCNLKEHFKRTLHYCKCCNRSYKNINNHLKSKIHKENKRMNRIYRKLEKGLPVLMDRPKRKRGGRGKGKNKKTPETPEERWRKYLDLNPEYKKRIEMDKK